MTLTICQLVLDPYTLNVVPRSLATTGVYIAIVALLAYFLSGSLYAWLQSIADSSNNEKSKAS
jgi:hypothetical protein